MSGSSKPTLNRYYFLYSTHKRRVTIYVTQPLLNMLKNTTFTFNLYYLVGLGRSQNVYTVSSPMQNRTDSGSLHFSTPQLNTDVSNY